MVMGRQALWIAGAFALLLIAGCSASSDDDADSASQSGGSAASSAQGGDDGSAGGNGGAGDDSRDGADPIGEMAASFGDAGAAIETGPGTGDATENASSSGTLSACLSFDAAPATCDEVCAAQGAACDSSGCLAEGAGALPSSVLFYSSLESCDGNRPALTQLGSCETDPGLAASLSPVALTHLRCCCDAAGDGMAASATEGVTLCAAICDGARPDYSDAPECLDADFCQPTCENLVLGESGDCARCIADGISWEPGSCNDFECFCPGPMFPTADSPECAAICAGLGG
jgi:hypothetical protein